MRQKSFVDCLVCISVFVVLHDKSSPNSMLPCMGFDCELGETSTMQKVYPHGTK